MDLLKIFKRDTLPQVRKEPRFHRRSYGGAKKTRFNADWITSTTSSDAELRGGLRVLRNRSRSLVRDNSYAKRIRDLLQGNIVGQGIGLQCVRTDTGGRRMDRENDLIEQQWWLWANGDGCHVSGLLSLTDILRLAVGEVFEAGEVLIRFVPQAFGHSKVPMAIEVIEAERLVDSQTTVTLPNGNTARMGVEMDSWGRPQAYWVYRGHPGDGIFRGYDSSEMVRIPADQCCHLYICNRWPQTRGEPWMSTVILRLRDTDQYTLSEMVAARSSANVMGFIQKPDDSNLDDVDDEEADERFHMEPGMIWKLRDGESFSGFTPGRPNSAAETFLRFMVREIAAGVGVSYEALSKDYSKSNYSSSRLSILDDRQGYRVLQQWLIRRFLYPLFMHWFRAATLAKVIDIPKAALEEEAWLMSVRFRPPGWSWVDPTKEVAAYREAVKAGFTTISDVIAQSGGGLDAEDVFKARRKELDFINELGLSLTTNEEQSADQQVIEVPDKQNE